MRGNAQTLEQGKFSLDTRGKSEACFVGVFYLEVIRHWSRLPREAMQSPSLEVYSARLGAAL